MQRLIVTVAALTVCAVSAPGRAQDGMVNQLEASVRLGVQLETEPDTTINFEDFGSRLRWNGALSMNDTAEVTGYLEFGFDEASGVSTTRQAWVGVSGDFGAITGGKQYRAFYDLSSSFTDIAYIGSCAFQIGCSRQEAVIKYVRELDEDLRIVASGTMQNDDDDNDLFDELEGGAIYQLGSVSIGAVLGFAASEGERDSGLALGVAAGTELGGIDLATSLQFAESDYAFPGATGVDDALAWNASASMDRWYAIAGVADNGELTPFYATLGYEYPLVDDALLYAEVQAFDSDDVDDQGFESDTELFVRTVFVYNFGAVGFPREGSR